jgi:phosphatidate cytidylyltransferase
MLRARVLSTVIGLPLLIVIVWFGEPWFTLLIVLWGALAAREFYALVSSAKVPAFTYFGLLFTVLIILSRNPPLLQLLQSYLNAYLLTSFLLASAAILSLLWLLVRASRDSLFNRWAWTMAGILYTGWLLSYLVALRGFEDGRNWVFFALLVNFASDTSAYFVGRALGRHYLAPQISPGKTWEGAVGAVAGATLIGLFFVLPTPLRLDLSWGLALLLSVLVSIFGQLGDLLESWFKRRMSVKDSGRLIPGHGGILDRMDSTVFAGVVVYYFVLLSNTF